MNDDDTEQRIEDEADYGDPAETTLQDELRWERFKERQKDDGDRWFNDRG